MEIYLDKDGLLNLEGNFSGEIWLTNKLDNLWMYDTLPEKIAPFFHDKTHVKFNIPLKYRKYGDVWQVYGVNNTNNIDISNNIELKKVNPLQIKLNRDVRISEIKVTNILSDKISLVRPLLKDEQVVAKRRINTNYGDAYFSNEYVLDTSSDRQTCFFNIPNFVDELNVTEEDIIDLFIKNKLHENRLKIDAFSDQRYSDETVGTMYKIYRNGSGSVSIYFYSKTPVYLKSVLWDGESIKLVPVDGIDANDINDIKLVETTKKARNSSARVFISLNSVTQDNSIIINDSFLYSEMRRRNKLSFKLFFSYKDSVIKNQFRTSKSEVLSINEKFKFTNINSKKFLSLELTSIKRNQVTKIAVLGSSHTRPMFTSSDFFNQLEMTNPDYLIIDVYIDVQMGVIYFGDGSVISYNSYQAESKYVLEHINEKPVLSTIFNDPKYVENYLNALNIFKNKILKIVPEDRIIIHAFDMSEDYKDKNSEIKQYKQSNGNIAELNEIAVGMQSLLENTFPKAKVLDIRDSKYHGGENNPLGNMPHHFESEYYKYLLNSLMKIIYLNNSI